MAPAAPQAPALSPPGPHHPRSLRSWSEVSDLPAFEPRLPKAAEVLAELAAAGDQRRPLRSVFDATAPPPVTVQDFLIRLCKHSHCSPQVWVCTLATADRMLSRSGLSFTWRNVHRIFLAAFVVTAKSRDDVSYRNKWYAAVAGVSLAELNVLELEFLRLVDWQVHTEADEYARYEQILDDEDASSENGLTDTPSSLDVCSSAWSASADDGSPPQLRAPYTPVAPKLKLAPAAARSGAP